MIRYRLFAFDSWGRIDRGFEHSCNNDDEAIQYAGSLLDMHTAEIEIMRDRKVIAHVRLQDGKVAVIPAL